MATAGSVPGFNEGLALNDLHLVTACPLMSAKVGGNHKSLNVASCVCSVSLTSQFN